METIFVYSLIPIFFVLLAILITIIARTGTAHDQPQVPQEQAPQQENTAAH